MREYRVNFGKFGSTRVRANGRYAALEQARDELGITSVSLAFLASIASVKVVDPKPSGGGRPRRWL